jgi:hypothetical protein
VSYGSADDWEAARRKASYVSAADLDGRRGTQDFTLADLDQLQGKGPPPMPPPEQIRIVPVEEFAAVDEPGATALVGSEDAALIPEGSDVMIYGDGGAGKSTLAFDLAFHIAAGEAWLDIPIPRPARVLMVENEGPRPLLRKKLRRKLAAWAGTPVEDRIRVFEAPWHGFTFASEGWRDEISLKVIAWEIDVLIVGPLTRVGMTEAGTLQQVAQFAALIRDLRERCARPLVVILIHHESKSGAVSGAWEGSGDTLLHVQSAGNGHTVVFVQKARWDPERHGTTMKLAWTDGEGFEREDVERDRLAEIVALLRDGRWRTAIEIAEPTEKGGIGAQRQTVKQLLSDHPELFESRTGDDAKALGRDRKATVWMVSGGSGHHGQESMSLPGVGMSCLTRPLRDGVSQSGQTASSDPVQHVGQDTPPASKAGIDYDALRGDQGNGRDAAAGRQDG